MTTYSTVLPKLNYSFCNPDLLTEALTHPSLGRKSTIGSYERLEFIGDSVLGMCIAELLFREYPDVAEGGLSRMHSNLVNTTCLASVAMKLDLGKYLIMDSGEESSGGRTNPRNLENAMEALLGAIFLDRNYQAVRGVVWSLWRELVEQNEVVHKRDFKSALQEWSQRYHSVLPTYQIIDKQGAAHEPIFTIKVSVGGVGIAIGQGKSRKQAEIQAAKILLEKVEK